MSLIKLVLVDPTKNTLPSIRRDILPLRPSIPEPGEAFRNLDLLDRIQAEMNGGYSVGVILNAGGYMVLESAQSDGKTVSFGRGEGWIPAERLKPFIRSGGPCFDYTHLELLAREKGYRVELIDSVPSKRS